MNAAPSPLLGVLQDFVSVAVARVGLDGRLRDASPPFKVLLGAAAGVRSSDVSLCFHDPVFTALSSMADAGYRGPMAVGCPGEPVRQVRGAVSRDGDALLVFAEVADWVELMEEVSALRASLAGKEGALARAQRELERQETFIQALQLSDPLTGLANRRKLEERLEMEVERARRYGAPLSLVVADMDRLADVNNQYGHDAGDAALRVLGKLLKLGARLSDLCARFGGGRFVAILPHAGVHGAMAFAERVRAQLSITPVELVEHPVTASFGAAEFVPGDTAESLMKHAGEALKRAKEAGRNRVLA